MFLLQERNSDFWIFWWKTSQVLYILICCVSCLWKPSNAPRQCLDGILHNAKPAVITMQSLNQAAQKERIQGDDCSINVLESSISRRKSEYQYGVRQLEQHLIHLLKLQGLIKNAEMCSSKLSNIKERRPWDEDIYLNMGESWYPSNTARQKEIQDLDQPRRHSPK